MSEQEPFANVLHEEMISKLARGPSHARGRAYFERAASVSSP